MQFTDETPVANKTGGHAMAQARIVPNRCRYSMTIDEGRAPSESNGDPGTGVSAPVLTLIVKAEIELALGAEPFVT